MFVPTVSLTLLGENVSTDEFGDAVDSYYAEANSLPAHIWQESKVAFEPASGRQVTTYLLKALVKTDLTLTVGKRLVDEATDAVYQITHVTEQHNMLGFSLPKPLELERVS